MKTSTTGFERRSVFIPWLWHSVLFLQKSNKLWIKELFRFWSLRSELQLMFFSLFQVKTGKLYFEQHFLVPSIKHCNCKPLHHLGEAWEPLIRNWNRNYNWLEWLSNVHLPLLKQSKSTTLVQTVKKKT